MIFCWPPDPRASYPCQALTTEVEMNTKAHRTRTIVATIALAGAALTGAPSAPVASSRRRRSTSGSSSHRARVPRARLAPPVRPPVVRPDRRGRRVVPAPPGPGAAPEAEAAAATGKGQEPRVSGGPPRVDRRRCPAPARRRQPGGRLHHQPSHRPGASRPRRPCTASRPRPAHRPGARGPGPRRPDAGASNPPQGPVLDLSDQWARLHDLWRTAWPPTRTDPGPTVIELNPPVATLPAVPFPDLPVGP